MRARVSARAKTHRRFINAIGLLLATTSLAGSTPEVKPFEYHPTNVEFWEKVDRTQKKNRFDDLVGLADEQRQHTKQGTIEQNEAKLATALGLQGLGLNFAATRMLGDVLKNSVGTDVAEQALATLEEIVKKAPVDEAYVLGEILTDLELEGLSPEHQDFVSFTNALFNRAHGYGRWAEAEFKKIHENSYWDYRLQYLRGIEDVAHNKIDVALDKFSKLASEDKTPDDIKTSAAHQQARLVFEKGDFETSYKMFKKVKLSPRERGLILLERAWAKYYQKDYAKALGLLYALEAPYFDTSRSPEPYVLKMVIYKELCHYEAALSIVDEFEKRFGTSLAVIKARGELRGDQMLVNMTVIDQSVEKWVNFFNNLKDERALLDKYNWDHFDFVKNIKRSYDLEIDGMRAKLSLILHDRIRKSADALLDWQEQITFLQYQTRLDSLRVVRPKSELPYKSEDVPHMTFDKTYWQRNSEFWLDELEDFKVLIESRCEDGGKK